jgi:hypothetical protein
MGTGTALASACSSVVAVAMATLVVTVATLAVTVDKPRGLAFCRPFHFAISLENVGEVRPYFGGSTRARHNR